MVYMSLNLIVYMAVPSSIAVVSLCLLATLSSFAHGGSLLHRLSQSNANHLTTTELWFNQTLDHFSPYDHRQFEQRYYEFFDHFRAPDGPIFLKICGEGPCTGIADDYLMVLAKKFGAAIVSLEHRYYGKSSPFKSLSTENLRYLSSKQALFDLAVFRQRYQVTTTIGFGFPNNANSYSVHGSALGAKEVDATRKNLGWAHEPLHVPADVKKHWSRHTSEGASLEAEWNANQMP